MNRSLPKLTLCSYRCSSSIVCAGPSYSSPSACIALQCLPSRLSAVSVGEGKLAAARASGTAEAANEVSEAYDACEPHPGDRGRCRLENGLAIQGQAPTALQLPAAADCR